MKINEISEALEDQHILFGQVDAELTRQIPKVETDWKKLYSISQRYKTNSACTSYALAPETFFPTKNTHIIFEWFRFFFLKRKEKWYKDKHNKMEDLLEFYTGHRTLRFTSSTEWPVFMESFGLLKSTNRLNNFHENKKAKQKSYAHSQELLSFFAKINHFFFSIHLRLLNALNLLEISDTS